MWTSPISASATGIWRNDKPVPQLFCRCAACANNWPGMSFSVDKRPLVRQLSPGFAAGQCGVRPMALRKQPTRAFPSENPARDIHAAQQAHRHLQRSGPAKNGFDATKELPAASARCCRTFHPAPRWPQAELPRARHAPPGVLVVLLMSYQYIVVVVEHRVLWG